MLAACQGAAQHARNAIRIFGELPRGIRAVPPQRGPGRPGLEALDQPQAPATGGAVGSSGSPPERSRAR